MFKSLKSSETRWNVFAQQVMMGMVNRERNLKRPPSYSMDQWPGYTAERMEIMQFCDQHKISNPVVLTGDIHSNWANELRIHDLNSKTEPVAVEFVTTSLSSGGNGSQASSTEKIYKSNIEIAGKSGHLPHLEEPKLVAEAWERFKK